MSIFSFFLPGGCGGVLFIHLFIYLSIYSLVYLSKMQDEGSTSIDMATLPRTKYLIYYHVLFYQFSISFKCINE